MPMFIDPNERIPISEFDPDQVISDEPPNVIYIRPKMDYATSRKVGAAGITLGTNGKETINDVSEILIANLTQNIVGWSGPLFDGVPCTAENIRRLNPDEPLIEKVIEEITRRNTKPSPNPKLADTSGFTSGTDTGSITPPSVEASAPQSAITNGRLRSHIVSTGLQKKSGG